MKRADLPTPSRRHAPNRLPPEPGRRLRLIGLGTLAAGIIAASVTYWLETRHVGPSLDELLPGYSRANSRQMGIYYGHAGKMMWEWREVLARPETHAALILVLAAVIGIGCLRVAWLDADRARDT